MQTEKQITPTQILKEDGTELNEVIKISVGANHILMLTKNKNVYSWGSNTYGALGNRENKVNEENKLIAHTVLGEGEAGGLDRIIDISAGAYGSTAINEFGWIYVWGNSSYGEIIGQTVKTYYAPVKTTLNNRNISKHGKSVTLLDFHKMVIYILGEEIHMVN